MRRQILIIAKLAVVAALVGTGAFLTISRAGSITGVQWNQIGPAPEKIDSPDCCQGNGTVSGQTVDIAVDPRGFTDQNIYIATQDGGIWQSTDGGNTWQTHTDFLNSLSMGSVALDPGDQSVVYAGTGDPANTGFFKGIGIYKSTDSGQTWVLVPTTGFNFNGQAIARMALPNPNTLLAATGNGLARSSDGGSTASSVLFGNITDVHVDTAATTSSAAPQTVFAAVSGVGMFESTDSGATWGANLWTAGNGSPLSVANFTPGFIAFAQSTKPTNQTIYASVQNTNAGGGPTFWGLFVSTDHGATWAQAGASGNPSNNCTQCGYDQTIGVDPLDATNVYLGFVDMWKSTDSGGSFSEIGHGNVHNDHHALTFSPHPPGSTPTTFYDGQDGGMALSSDGGGSFLTINGPDPGPGQALATSLLRNMDIGRGSAANNKFSYGGMQDTGTAQFTNSSAPTTWHLNLGGDGAGVAVDPFDPTRAIGMADACLNNTTNGGGGWSGAGFGGVNFGGIGFGFGNTLAYDQVNSGGKDNTVYASGLVATTPGQFSCFGICFGFTGNGGTCTGPELFRSTDGGSNYAQFATPTVYPAQINAIATTAADPNIVWLALQDGTLEVSTNATTGSPSFAAPGSQPAGGGAGSAVAIDPTNPKTVVATFAGTFNQVFITTDGGTTWANISTGLPTLPVHAVVIDPSTTPHTIIIGNDAGVLQTADGGATWQVLGVGMPTVDVTSLSLDTSVNPELLRAGTFGRSAFEFGAATGPLLSINTTLNFGTTCPVQTPTEQLQLFNVGSAPLTITSINRVSGSSDFTLTGPSFPVTIQPGEQIQYTVNFTPKLANEGTTETATFQINSNDEFKPTQQITYTATVGQPNGSTLIANGGNFGNVCVGSFADLNLTISNKGTCDLLVSGITTTTVDFLAPSTLVYPVTVEPGNSIAAPVRFAPQSLGLKADVVTVHSNNNLGGNMSVNVTGNAPPGKITVSGSGMFGDVCAGTNAQQTITIGNVGACNLNVSSVTIDDGHGGPCPDFTIENNPFPNTLSPDSSLPVTIAFTPTSGGAKSCRLVITSDDPSNPTITIPLTADTPSVMIDVPPDQGFPATVVQTVGACNSQAPFPISNKGTCPLTITDVSIGTPGSNPTDFTRSGLPSLPNPVQPGHTLGDGNLKLVFAPAGPSVSRTRTGTVSVTYKSDPILPTTTTVTRMLCGEAARTGARVLVTVGGVAAPTGQVTKIQISRLTSNRKSISVDNLLNPPLVTVPQPLPCASFQYHAEWGASGDQTAQLTTGDYQVTVTALVNGKKATKTVSFTLGTCSFNQNVVVAF